MHDLPDESVAAHHDKRTDNEVEGGIPQGMDVARDPGNVMMSRPQEFSIHQLRGPAKLANPDQGGRCSS